MPAARVLDTAAKLTCEQLLAPGGARFDSVRDTLVPTMNAHDLLYFVDLRNDAARPPR